MQQQHLWHVQVHASDTRAMTLDDLVALFEAGQLHESAWVLPPGSTQWTTLAQAAGLDAAPDSLAPMQAPTSSLDVNDDDGADFRPKRGRLFVGAAVVVALGVAGAAFLVRAGQERAGEPVPVAAGPQSGVEALPEPERATGATAARLTEDQKRALLEADKKRFGGAREPRHGGAAAPAPAKGKKKDPFSKDGERFDPLNGKL